MSDLRVDITFETQDCSCHSPHGRHWYDCPAARIYVMSAEEREAQRRSFAYGNAAIGNPRVTRKMIDAIASRPPLDITPPSGLAWWVRLLVRLARFILRRYVP